MDVRINSVNITRDMHQDKRKGVEGLILTDDKMKG